MNEDIRRVTHVQNIRYDKDAERLYIIDQTLLPNEEREIELRTIEEMVEAIKKLRIGARRPSASARATACMCWPGALTPRTTRLFTGNCRSTVSCWGLPGPRQ